jgi:hypothetical protein
MDPNQSVNQTDAPITTTPNNKQQMVRQLAKALEGRVDVHEVMVDRICVDRRIAAEAIEVGDLGRCE